MEEHCFPTCVSGLSSMYLDLTDAWLYRMFVREGMVLGLVALLLLAYYLGKSMNQRRARSWQVAESSHPAFSG